MYACWRGVIAKYLAGDDLFSLDFLEGVYIVYPATGPATLDSSTISM